MPRFNIPQKPIQPQVVPNYAGGTAYQRDAKSELASILLTSFADDTYYREAGDVYSPNPSSTFGRLKQLLSQVDPLFAAKAAVYTRNVIGLRSISQYMAYLIGRYGILPWRKDAVWSKDGAVTRFFTKVVRRPDDMLEMAALFLGDKKPLPHAARRAWREVIAAQSPYSLAKYRGDGKTVSMVDLVNLVHAKSAKTITVPYADYLKAIDNGKARKADGDAIEITTVEALCLGLLKQTDTWEDKLTKAGEDAALIDNEDEKAEALAESKAAVWAELIKAGKLGYFALVRNLRNIIEQADNETFAEAMTQLVSEPAIQKSLLFPVRFLSAYEALLTDRSVRAVLAKTALNEAASIAAKNVPVWEDSAAIFLDDSGSMEGKPFKDGAMMAMTIAYANPQADFWTFGSGSKKQNPSGMNLLGDVFDLIKNQRSGGTDFGEIGRCLTGKTYKHVLVLSDMQAWVGQGFGYTASALKMFMDSYPPKPQVVCIDLNGLGTMQTFGNNVLQLFGYSDKIYDLMKRMGDPNALVKEIEAVVI